MITALCLASLANAEPARFLRYPDIHGSKVVFTSESDLWLGDTTSGEARRLTADAGIERNAEFSPDGATIAFEGEYDGLREAYVMPASGGAPKRLTLSDMFRAVTGWTPDGQSVVFRKVGYPTNYAYYTVPAKGGAPQPMPLEFASHVSFAPSGNRYTFTRFNRWYAAWWRYIGGMQNQIWVYNGTSFQQITQEKGTCEYPVWCGSHIYYALEHEGQFLLRRVPATGGRPETVAGPFREEVRELGGDGQRVVFEVGVGARVYDTATGRVSTLEFKMLTDDARTRPYLVSAGTFSSGASITPTGKRIMADPRGQIVDAPFGEGEARVWKSAPGARLRLPVMSPDAKHVAYVSDEGGEQQIWIANSDGSGAKKVTSGSRRQIMTIGWSPDGKWIDYYSSAMELRIVSIADGSEKKVTEMPFSWFGVPHEWSPDSKWIVHQGLNLGTDQNQVGLFEVSSGTSTVLSDGLGSDLAPAFSDDGKYVAFLSQRSLGVSGDPMLNQLNLGQTVVAYIAPVSEKTTSPFLTKDETEAPKDAKPTEEKPKEDKPKEDPGVEIEVSGLFARRIQVPVPAGEYSQIEMVGNRVILAGGGQITYYDVSKKAGGTITPGGSFQVSGDQKKLLVDGRRAVDVGGDGVPATSGLPKTGALMLSVEPVKEWAQMYWDAWRLLRDFFYVENMHGLDWKAVGDKYAQYLPSVRSRDELDELIRWMQCELGSSHQYLTTGDARDIKTRLTAGYLGIDLVPAENGSYKIGHICRGDGFLTTERSPLAEPSLNVKEGMYVIEIAGIPTQVGNDIFGGLVGRVGQVVGVRVNDKPGREGSRVVYVKPVASETRMRSLDWVAANREYVTKRSEGKVGYIYLDAMGTEDMSDFVKQYFPQRGKDALLVDVRFNNGGFVQDYIIRILSQKLSGFFNMRESPGSWTRQQDYFSGPLACLINEFSISCGEEFPYHFKDAKLGPLIGRRTMGGEVGSSPGWPLMDGGVVNVPNYGMWVPGKGWVIEGEGVKPDIDVPSDPNQYVKGADPQLDAGVDWLLEEARKRPPVKRIPPPDRDRVGKG